MRNENESVRFEEKDIRPVAVVGAGVGLLLGTLGIVFLLWFVFVYFRSAHPAPEPRPGVAPVFQSMRQPVLQASPNSDLEALRARDFRILNHYTWVDRTKGVVSIPIDRAIEKLVSEGMPPVGDYSDLKLVPPRAGSRQSGF
jgi:hypothetical protein